MAEPPSGERARVPTAVLDLVCSEVEDAVGTPDSLLELWAERGQMLPRAVEVLRPRRARALFSGPVPDAWPAVPEVRVGTMGEQVEPAQVVLGVPPWRWAPAAVSLPTPDGPVRLLDDPAHVELLTACAAMPDGGVAAAVVGLGFLARRGEATVTARLPRFGLRIARALALDPGLFRPLSGPGRVLVVLRRKLVPPA